MFGGKTSKPKYFELGYFFASSMLDLPVPQPKSAKATPFSSFCVISGILSVQSVTRKDLNKILKYAKFESQLLKKINDLNIGPLGMGGKTTALSVKFTGRYSHPASMFVGISIGCWCLRRRTLKLS